MTLIKICGITNVEDALFCAGQGADFLGLIFVPSSPRYIPPEHAADIVVRMPGTKFVGVFRDEPVDDVRQIATEVGVTYVQFHGNETDDEIAAVGMPAIKVVRVGDTLPVVNTAAEWVMFDSGGGTGRPFDWNLIEGYTGKRFFLAGGLTPDNVGDAIAAVRPDAVDVASGVESAPGVKDHAKVRAFFRKVRG